MLLFGIAQGNNYALARLALAIAIRFQQLKDLAGFGALQTKKHADDIGMGSSSSQELLVIYSPYKMILEREM